MKRVGNLMTLIAERENLRRAFALAQRGRRVHDRRYWRASKLEHWLDGLRLDIVAGSVEVGQFERFVIHDPKRRVIHAASFRERVLHHALMAHAGPVMDRLAIDDSYACRVGRGVHRARRRVQHFGRRFECFVKLDVRRYFDSVAHEVLEGQLPRLFKEARLLELFGRIIDAHHVEPGCGLPIGSLTSQHFANLYLAPLDHFIKEQLRCRGYVRYMDDLLLLGDDASALARCQDAVQSFCRECLRIELKPRPVRGACADGIPFLGARVTRAAIYPDRRTRRRLRRKLSALEAAVCQGSIGVDDVERRVPALLGQVAHTSAPPIATTGTQASATTTWASASCQLNHRQQPAAEPVRFGSALSGPVDGSPGASTSPAGGSNAFGEPLCAVDSLLEGRWRR